MAINFHCQASEYPYAFKCLHISFVYLFSKCVKKESVVAQSCPTLPPHGLQPTRLLCPQDSQGENTGLGSHSLLQGVFQTQGLNSGLLPCRQVIYRLSYQGSPPGRVKILHLQMRRQWFIGQGSKAETQPLAPASSQPAHNHCAILVWVLRGAWGLSMHSASGNRRIA